MVCDLPCLFLCNYIAYVDFFFFLSTNGILPYLTALLSFIQSVIDILGWIILCDGAVLHMIGVWQHPWALPISTNPLQKGQPEISPNIAKCPLGIRVAR